MIVPASRERRLSVFSREDKRLDSTLNRRSRDARGFLRASRTLKRTAKFRPSLRDEEGSHFAQKFG
jgi:hypothetical protein